MRQTKNLGITELQLWIAITIIALLIAAYIMLIKIMVIGV